MAVWLKLVTALVEPSATLPALESATRVTYDEVVVPPVVTLTAAPGDTPTGAGVVRINGNPHTYTGRAGNVLSGLSPVVPGGGYAAGLPVFIPFLDGVAAGATLTSGAFQYDAPFTVRYRVRNGGGAPIVPFESTLSVTEAGGSGNTVRTADA